MNYTQQESLFGGGDKKIDKREEGSLSQQHGSSVGKTCSGNSCVWREFKMKNSNGVIRVKACMNCGRIKK